VVVRVAQRPCCISCGASTHAMCWADRWERAGGSPTMPRATPTLSAVSRAFPSCTRSIILTEIYLCHACSCPKLRMESHGGGFSGAGLPGGGTGVADAVSRQLTLAGLVMARGRTCAAPRLLVPVAWLSSVRAAAVALARSVH
jgi:hypothetical protein